jgi:putative oxidoreductase
MDEEGVTKMQGWGLMLLRVVVGIVFLVHGFQKLFFMGFGGVAGMMEGLGVPAPVLFAVILTLVEVLGGLALILGLFTRVAAVPLAIDMLVATLMVHLPNGFSAANGGYEFTLVLLVASLALAVAGPGEAALDRMLATRMKNPSLARLVR